MKLTKTLPSKVGQQFVCLYEYNNQIWSQEYRINSDGQYMEFMVSGNLWRNSGKVPWETYHMTNVTYVLAE